MNRRNFLRTCLGGAAAVVAAPFVALGQQPRRKLTDRQLRQLLDAMTTRDWRIAEAAIEAGYRPMPGKLIRSSEGAFGVRGEECRPGAKVARLARTNGRAVGKVIEWQ